MAEAGWPGSASCIVGSAYMHITPGKYELFYKVGPDRATSVPAPSRPRHIYTPVCTQARMHDRDLGHMNSQISEFSLLFRVHVHGRWAVFWCFAVRFESVGPDLVGCSLCGFACFWIVLWCLASCGVTCLFDFILVTPGCCTCPHAMPCVSTTSETADESMIPSARQQSVHAFTGV